MSDTIDVQEMLEKRRDYRMPCARPIQVALRTEAVPLVGEVQDLSASGLRMRLNRVLHPGAEYTMYLAPDAGHDGVFVAASPVWIKATDDGYGFEIGCRFTDGARTPRPAPQQRRAVRLSGTFDTLLVGPQRLRIHAVTKDVSLSGAGIVSAVSVEPGTRLQARFDLVPHGILKATVEVVHCHALAGDLAGYQLGVAFWPMEAREARRLRNVLLRLKSH